MAEPPKPHVVPRAPKPEEPAPPKRVVEARPTCKVDKNELLGLVGRTMRTRSPTLDPDAPEVEVTTSTSDFLVPSKPPSALPVEKRVVRTVARRTPVAGMQPISVEPVAPTPPPVLAAKPAGTEEYVDLFAEGSEPSIGVHDEPAPARQVAAEAAPVASVVDAVIEMPSLESVPMVGPTVTPEPSPEVPVPVMLGAPEVVAVRAPDAGVRAPDVSVHAAPVVPAAVTPRMVAPSSDRQRLILVALIVVAVLAILAIALL